MAQSTHFSNVCADEKHAFRPEKGIWRAVAHYPGLSIEAVGLFSIMLHKAYCYDVCYYAPVSISVRQLAEEGRCGTKVVLRVIRELIRYGLLQVLRAAKGNIPPEYRLCPFGRPKAEPRPRPTIRDRVNGLLSAVGSVVGMQRSTGPSVVSPQRSPAPPDPRARTGETKKRETAPPGGRAHPTGARTASGAYDEPPRAIPPGVAARHAATLARLRGLGSPDPATRLH